MRHSPLSHQIPEPSAEDLDRIGDVLYKVGGRNVNWGAQGFLDVWLIEQRAILDQRMAERIRNSSWALVGATIGLVCAVPA